MGCFLFSGLFWGIVLILIGLSIIVKIAFNINVPVFRSLFALFLIYLGIRVLIGGFFCDSMRRTSCFAKDLPLTAANVDYNILFSKGVVDLKNIKLEGSSITKKINVVFADGLVKIAPEIPVKIFLDSAFSAAKLPDGSFVSFGKNIYSSPGLKDNDNCLILDAKVVFGKLDIVTEKQ